MFDQVAKFSITGLLATTVMAFLGGFEPAAYPWF